MSLLFIMPLGICGNKQTSKTKKYKTTSLYTRKNRLPNVRRSPRFYRINDFLYYSEKRK